MKMEIAVAFVIRPTQLFTGYVADSPHDLGGRRSARRCDPGDGAQAAEHRACALAGDFGAGARRLDRAGRSPGMAAISQAGRGPARRRNPAAARAAGYAGQTATMQSLRPRSSVFPSIAATPSPTTRPAQSPPLPDRHCRWRSASLPRRNCRWPSMRKRRRRSRLRCQAAPRKPGPASQIAQRRQKPKPEPDKFLRGGHRLSGAARAH